jgi:hypothetical protein
VIAIRALISILPDSILSGVQKETGLEGIVRAELRLHPHLAPVDLQKLLLQAVFGGDHLFVNPKRFRRALREEWSRLDASLGGAIPPLQAIDPGGRTARLHLGPCRGRGISVDEVSRFLLSQPPKGGTVDRLGSLWDEVVDLARCGRIPFDAQTLAVLPFPSSPAHHSSGYGPAAYRIVHDLTMSATEAWVACRLEGR